MSRISEFGPVAGTSTSQASRPILIELDPQSWERQIDHVEKWLGNVLMVQSAFRQLVQSVRDKLHEPHLRNILVDVVDTAAKHERKAEELFQLVGRVPSSIRRQSGALLSAMRRAGADVVGLAGGAAPPFRDLQQLLMASLDSTSAFAVAEQLGLALGIRELAETCYTVVAEKYTHQLVIQELALESAACAILYQTELAEPDGPTLAYAADGRQTPTMPMNVGPQERYLRLAIGASAGAAALNLLRRGNWLGLPLAGIAASGIFTGITRHCPLNALLGADRAHVQCPSPNRAKG